MIDLVLFALELLVRYVEILNKKSPRGIYARDIPQFIARYGIKSFPANIWWRIM